MLLDHLPFAEDAIATTVNAQHRHKHAAGEQTYVDMLCSLHTMVNVNKEIWTM